MKKNEFEILGEEWFDNLLLLTDIDPLSKPLKYETMSNLFYPKKLEISRFDFINFKDLLNLALIIDLYQYKIWKC